MFKNCYNDNKHDLFHNFILSGVALHILQNKTSDVFVMN